MNKLRLTEEERLRIENGLRERRMPYAIAKALGRPVRTVVRKIRARRVPSGKGTFGHVTNRCVRRKDCTRRRICAHCAYDCNQAKSVAHKVDTRCRNGRTYADYQLFLGGDTSPPDDGAAACASMGKMMGWKQGNIAGFP